MPTLKLNFKDKTLGDYPLQKSISLTIGRRKNNDVVIDNLAVSSHHAKIDSVGEGFVLIDLQSKNGSFVNEQLINSHWLENGDIISIGKHSLVFSYSEDEELPDEDSDAIDKTMVMDTSQYRSMVNKSKPKVEEPLKSQKRKDTIGILAFLNGEDNYQNWKTSRFGYYRQGFHGGANISHHQPKTGWLLPELCQWYDQAQNQR